MKKFLLILSIYILFISPVSADFFDNWSDDNICGWMDNPSTPKYIMEESDKRELNCKGGFSILTSEAKKKKVLEKTLVEEKKEKKVTKEKKSK